MHSPSASPATLTSVLERIRAFARAREWSPGRLAVEAGLSRGTLKRLYEPDFLPSGTTIHAIERLIPADWCVGDALPAAEAANAEVLAEQNAVSP